MRSTAATWGSCRSPRWIEGGHKRFHDQDRGRPGSRNLTRVTNYGAYVVYDTDRWENMAGITTSTTTIFRDPRVSTRATWRLRADGLPGEARGFRAPATRTRTSTRRTTTSPRNVPAALTTARRWVCAYELDWSSALKLKNRANAWRLTAQTTSTKRLWCNMQYASDQRRARFLLRQAVQPLPADAGAREPFGREPRRRPFTSCLPSVGCHCGVRSAGCLSRRETVRGPGQADARRQQRRPSDIPGKSPAERTTSNT